MQNGNPLNAVQAKLCCALGEFQVNRLAGREAISEISQFTVTAHGELRSQAALTDHNASLQINSASGQQVWHGVLSKLDLRQLAGKTYRLQVTFNSRLMNLAQRHSRLVLVGQTVQECVQKILRGQYTARQIQFHLQQVQSEIAYTIQSPYESDWKFLLRVLLNAGLVLFERQQHKMASIVMCDARMQHPLADPWLPDRRHASLQIDNTAAQHGYVLQSTELGIAVGFRRRVQCETKQLTLDRQCLITAIEHRLMETPQEQYAYHNRAFLLPAPQNFPRPEFSKPLFPNFMPAQTAGSNDQISLDPHGCYQVNVDWDKTRQTLPPLARVTTFAGGMHVPIAGAQRVLVSCRNGDPALLCITATLPHGIKPELIDLQHPYSNVWRSTSGQEIIFCDQPNNSYCCVQSPKAYNRLKFSALGIELNTGGSLRASAEGTLNLHAGRDLQTQLSEQLTLCAIETLQLTAQRGSIRLRAQADINLQAQGNSVWSAHDIVITGQRTANIRTVGDFTVQAQQIHCQSFADLHINAEGDIVLKGDGCGDLCLHQGNKQIRLTASGDIELIADTIHFKAQHTLSCEGKVNIVD